MTKTPSPSVRKRASSAASAEVFNVITPPVGCTLVVESDAPSAHVRQYMSSWRFALRHFLLGIVLWETPLIVYIQSFRRPWLDFLFARVMTVLGTHTMFLMGLPVCFWFLDGQFARHITIQLAVGVILTNNFKDLFCLPRPKSPPVQQLLHKRGTYHILEYGMPSTHSCNAASISLMIAIYYGPWLMEQLETSGWPLASGLIVVSWLFYLIFLPLSRVYCGMHSFIDVIFGSMLGAAVTAVEWYIFSDGIESWLRSNSPDIFPQRFLSLLLLGCAYIGWGHPNPIDACPCFDDSVCYVGVLIGMLSGQQRLFANKGILDQHYDDNLTMQWYIFRHGEKTESHSSLALGLSPFTVLLRLALGMVCLLVWRALAKAALLTMLKPLYLALGWPLTYKPDEIMVKTTCDGTSHVHMPTSSQLLHDQAKHDKSAKRALYVMPRHALDILVKVLTYTGIGWLSVEWIPMLFQYALIE